MFYNVNIPEDIVEYIISFTCDRRGYNMMKYIERKNANRYRMRRLVKEISYFGKTGYCIAWLKPICMQRKKTSRFKKSLKAGKPSVEYHTGCYVSYGGLKK